MKRSSERIITTHAGSLKRPEGLLELLSAKARNEPVDEELFAAKVREAVFDTVRAEAEHGVDVVNDGEVGKPGYQLYALERLTGFEPRQREGQREDPNAGSREYLSFPDFYVSTKSWSSSMPTEWVCAGPIAYKGHDLLARDVDNLRAALADVKVEEAFIPAISPSNLAMGRRNEYYADDDEYLSALADALHEEYRAIVDAGFLVQIDDPYLATYYTRHPELSIEDCRRWAGSHVELINQAIGDIPADRVRFHTCYSINMGPRLHDVEAKHLMDIILQINAGAYSFEAANPRHDHEWRLWESLKLPEGKIIIPGVITNSTIVIEHPELVAQRIVRFADLVGRENVIAGADCGFSTMARSADALLPSIAWAKFDALSEGARIASQELWGR